jgi:hypothetical protein
MASRTSSSSASRARPAGARAALLSGLASVACLPLAVYLTRFSDAYRLRDAGFAIPLAGALGVVAIALARRSLRRSALSLRGQGDTIARAAWVLGVAGTCLALAALVALAVYGLLEYAGTRG